MRKMLYGRAVKLDKILKAAPGISKALVVLFLGGVAGREYCRGSEGLAYCLVGIGIFISLSGFRKRNGNGVAKS